MKGPCDPIPAYRGQEGVVLGLRNALLVGRDSVRPLGPNPSSQEEVALSVQVQIPMGGRGTRPLGHNPGAQDRKWSVSGPRDLSGPCTGPEPLTWPMGPKG